MEMIHGIRCRSSTMGSKDVLGSAMQVLTQCDMQLLCGGASATSGTESAVMRESMLGLCGGIAYTV